MSPSYNLPPGPRQSRLSFRALADALEASRDPLGFFGRHLEQYGDVVSFLESHRTTLLVKDPDHIKHFMVDNGAN